MSSEQILYEKLITLNERLWNGRATRPAIDLWLENFADVGGDERLQALYLLSQFIYFADREVRELLRALYRDLYRYPIIEELRRQNGDTTDAQFLDSEFQDELARTRFLGIGNPAESGTHLLYFFRQENRIARTRFASVPELFDRALNDPDVALADPTVTRIVFVDDFCGSGSQAITYSRGVLKVLRDVEARDGLHLRISYLVLVGMASGLQHVRDHTLFDEAAAVFELDWTYKSLDPGSRHFENPVPGVTRERAREVAHRYGVVLSPDHPLGWEDGQLLLGFHHNVPDNTLPIIWWDEDQPPWRPIIRRYPKIYG
jgi:hypothetical protein